jgi:hypothetical protein
MFTVPPEVISNLALPVLGVTFEPYVILYALPSLLSIPTAYVAVVAVGENLI